MRNRRPSPEHEQAVARRLALLTAEWDTAKAVGGKALRVGVTEAVPGGDGVEPAGGEWPWNPPTRVAGGDRIEEAPLSVVVVEAVDPQRDAEAVVEAEHLPLVRSPGRHAARRGPGRAVRGVAESLTARFVPPVDGVRARLSSVHLTWVAVFVAIALGATCWWLVGAKESAVLTPVSASFSESGGKPTPEPAEAAESSPTRGSPDDSGTPRGVPSDAVGEVVVDVAGKVRRPGIVVLPAGSRVADAIEAAGGARRGVDLSSLNLARRLLDGEQILVGKTAATGVGAAPAPGAPSSDGGALVNLNSASQTELETLPGVGPVTAAAIIEWRTRHGGFTAVEDLLEVDGIGDATLKRLASLVSV